MRNRAWWLLSVAVLVAACAPLAPRDDAAVLTAPPADWAAYAGRRVRIEAPLVVVDTHALGERGELVVAFGERVPIPTEAVRPGADATARDAADARRVLTLDDGLDTAPADAAEPLPALPGAVRLRAGSQLTHVAGTVVADAHGVRLVPEAGATIAAAPRPAPPTVPGNLRLASFNVLNLFNGDGHGGGFPTPRGAKTHDGYVRQQAKLVAAVQALAPDAAALMEVENDGYGPDSALARFVAALNAAGPVRDYAFIDAGSGPGNDQIRVAILFRRGVLAPVGAPAVLDGGPFAERSRVPMAQAFRRVDADASAPTLVLVAVHFKSKGCGSGERAATGANADQHDGQSCWNPVRLDSAQRVEAWLRTDPTHAHTDRTVLLGDFNAYGQEDPVRWLREAGWVDAFARFPEPGLEYSFVFDGRAGRLDHALLSPAAAALLRGAAHWHNNADEPAASRYDGGSDVSPYGASDHDPLLLGLEL